MDLQTAESPKGTEKNVVEKECKAPRRLGRDAGRKMEKEVKGEEEVSGE